MCVCLYVVLPPQRKDSGPKRHVSRRDRRGQSFSMGTAAQDAYLVSQLELLKPGGDFVGAWQSLPCAVLCCVTVPRTLRVQTTPDSLQVH